MFANPSRQLPGKWELYEYYTEPKNELINIKKQDLKEKNHFLEIEFAENEKVVQRTNLHFPFFSENEQLQWSRSKNFITLINPGDFRKNIEFQFAIENDTLKLLKKDAFGKIEFFGFFNKLKSSPNK